MKKLLLLTLILLPFLKVFSQVTGSWQGVLIQKNADGTTANYAVWLDLKTQGNNISGSYRSEQINSPYYRVSEIIGKIEGNKITLKEKFILKDRKEKDMIWCFIIVKLNYDRNKDELKGRYTTETEGCDPGEIVLLRSNKKFNSSETEITELSTLENVTDLLSQKKSIVGKQFILKNVHFQSAKYNITSNSYAYLNQLVKILKENEKINIHLKGHTDSDGKDESNFILSQKRAKSIANYFIKHHINENRISYEGFGKSRPINGNNSEQDKQQNRRVELLIISQ